jgi:hypothetical protein
MPDYYEQLDQAKALGLEYATNGIEAGEIEPIESPLSEEWADAITRLDVFKQVVGRGPTFAELSFEVDDLADHWEDGYNSAPWPGRAS